ncbi:hypothetical protein [Xenorhabdus miraniensis]|uniref:Type III secretion system effector EspK n=1 Tax=Xenorhabdus miraniensis TaxID=351674 RepID=A0A2D0JNK4_9GAMM|nr:hypothetical protein [Xenorhabdus miraniensis]PHM47879.1 Type III secretion system effector EspK [Xenorhabdus miraniensis]
MPFYPPFKTSFEQGDLIFGLSRERVKYAQKYPQFGFARFLDTKNISTIDRYSITQREYDIRKKFEHKIPSNQESFDNAIKNHCKYNSIRHYAAKLDIDFGSKNVHYPEQVTSRKCKAGLSWFSQSLTRSCIHFILDEIDIERVIYKLSENKRKKKSSYTGSELRWIYRNRRDPKVRSCIQFWREGVPVAPPWIEGKDASLWQNYHPKFENSEIELGEFAETALGM